MEREKPMEEIEFAPDGIAKWAGLSDYKLISPDRVHQVLLAYAGEPPHGDSYHTASADGNRLPGFFWGCMFAYSPDSRYFAASWMQQLFERSTVVIDLKQHSLFALPVYIHAFKLQWPLLEGVGRDVGASYRFEGLEKWLPY